MPVIPAPVLEDGKWAASFAANQYVVIRISVYGHHVDVPFAMIQTRAVATHLNQSGHSAAARAMLRVTQLAVLPAATSHIDVWLQCSDYDFHLLSALTLSSPGSRSRALDDAYSLVFPWLNGPFRFRFIVRREGAKTA